MASRTAHIAMIGNPVISHTLPGIEIIRELVARGHRVTYANDPFLADLVTSTGAELRPYRSTLPPVTGGTWPEDPVEGMTVFLDDAVRMLPQLHALYDDDPADLYLYDIGGYAGRALAESQGRPTLQLSPTRRRAGAWWPRPSPWRQKLLPSKGRIAWQDVYTSVR